jgi:2-C-methyl-D-erythritol 4-phosphate cytidylyltransferase
MPNVGVILVAAGQSSRFRDAHYKKPFAPLAGRAVWLHAAEKFLDRDDVKQLVVVIAPDDREMFLDKFGANLAFMGIELTVGGDKRATSVRNGLAKLSNDIDLVAVHDAARPCLAMKWIDEVFTVAGKTGAAILANPVTATLKRVSENSTITDTVDRTGLWEAQTPQVFSRQLLTAAFAADATDTATDEAQLIQATGHPVTVVAGSPMNIKITTRDDLRLAEQILKALPKPRLGGPSHPFADDDRWR